MKSLKLLLIGAILASVGSAAVAAGDELNIAYVKSPFNLQNIVMKPRGMLEKEFAAEKLDVKWQDINSGAKQTQALASGALDVSAVMNTTSLLMSAAQGNQISAVTGVAHPSNVFAIVGKAGKQLTVSELKGKTVVGPRGTVLHQVLVAALAKNGMTIKDVNFVSMDPPKAYAALVSGKVDAALLAAGLIIKANKNGMKTIVTADGLVSPNLVMVASNRFAQENPEMLARVVKVHREALAWIKANKTAALEMGAKEQGVSVEDAEKLYDWSGFYDVLTQKDIDGLKADQKFLLDNGMMNQAIDVRTVVFPSAMR